MIGSGTVTADVSLPIINTVILSDTITNTVYVIDTITVQIPIGYQLFG